MKEAFSIIFVGIFVFLMGVASSLGEITSFLLIDFSKSLSEVGSPILGVGEIGVSLMAIGFLFMGVLCLVE